MSNMSTLPPLNALKAFAAAGRQLNMTAAAKELFVTPSALSHQIRGLENLLGIKLFIRTRHGLKLTDAGLLILPGLNDAFDQMSNTMALLKPGKDNQILTISMLSTFAMRWFIPRLSRFQQQHADIDVRISTSVELVNFDRDDVDCTIRFGAGHWPGLTAIRLFTEQLTPVCSPRLATTERPLDTPRNLENFTLLHARLRPDDWRIWLNAVGLNNFKMAHEQIYETRNFAIQAAVDGLGVAVVDPSLAAGEIESGRLIQPFRQTLTGENAYYLVYPQKRETDPAIIALQNWLLDESTEPLAFDADGAILAALNDSKGGEPCP
jgi:LysR family glycine cleavage system transcriptional activator